MLTKLKRVLLRDGKFGYLVRQVVDGATPLYLATTVHGSQLITAAGDFIATEWDGAERRRDERRRAQVPLEAGVPEWHGVDRRTSAQRQFVISWI